MRVELVETISQDDTHHHKLKTMLLDDDITIFFLPTWILKFLLIIWVNQGHHC
jgi:hypothetical protein